MSSQNVGLDGDELTDQQIWELNSANASLRATLIFLIVVVIIFAIMQLIKLIYQIRAIRSRAEEATLAFDSEVPKIVVCARGKRRSSKKKRSKRSISKHSLPSKEMKVQLSLTKKPEQDMVFGTKKAAKEETTVKKSETKPQNTAEANIAAAASEGQESLDPLPPVVAKDSLAYSGGKPLLPAADSKNSPSTTKSTDQKKFSPVQAQDSLMVVNNSAPLQPAGSAETTPSGQPLKTDSGTIPSGPKIVGRNDIRILEESPINPNI